VSSSACQDDDSAKAALSYAYASGQAQSLHALPHLQQQQQHLGSDQTAASPLLTATSHLRAPVVAGVVPAQVPVLV
jgi:hypothetical protein